MTYALYRWSRINGGRIRAGRCPFCFQCRDSDLGYESVELTLLNTVFTADAIDLIPETRERAIKETSNAYSTKSWPCSLLVRFWSFT
jgi:hypothetical protein